MIKAKWLEFMIPPEKWEVPVIIVFGVFSGLFLFLINISKATSYLSDNPKTCVNCHIMAPQYATWSHSAHHEVTNCNDCHVPHNNIFNKYYFKAKDGLRHATLFTLRLEPQVIFIGSDGKDVVQSNCIRCHESLIDDPKMSAFDLTFWHTRIERKCWDCHRETPHGIVNSLSSVPYARIPLPENPVPDWLKFLIENKQ
jgi:cytochrome c nitrite reductase small subunit